MRRFLFRLLVVAAIANVASAQVQQPSFPAGNRQAGSDSSSAGRDTARILLAGPELTEYGISVLRPLDVSLDRFQLYQPVYRVSLLNATLGNNGTAWQQFVYRPAFNHGFNWGFNTFALYNLRSEDVLFYDAQSPHTHAFYVQGPEEETQFSLLHTQNIGKAWNFGINYRRVAANGLYQRQAVSHSALQLHTWFRPQESRYQALFTAVYNNSVIQENGGITPLGDTLFREAIETNRKLIPVNLAAARNRVFSNGGMLRQAFDLVKGRNDSTGTQPLIRIQHTLNYTFRRHTYEDGDVAGYSFYGTVADPGLPWVAYVNEAWESEAALLKLSILPDTVRRMRWEAKAFVKQQFVRVLMPHAVAGELFDQRVTNQSVGGFLRYYFSSQIQLHGKAEAFYAGYNAGDMLLDGRLIFRPVTSLRIEGGVESFRQEPEFQLSRFVSNFGSWDNHFSKVSLLHLHGRIVLEQLHLELGLSNRLTGNYIYLSQQGVPSQATTAVNVLGLYIDHKLHWKKWHLYSRIIYQQVGNEAIIRLPALQAQESLFREGRLGGKTSWRIGIDLMAASAFRANAYQPYSGLFYLQDGIRNKGLLQADLYVSAKIRRARCFVKFEHVNAGLSGYDYLIIPYYPLNDRVLKLGLSWMFFD